MKITGSKGAVGRALGINETNMRNVWKGRPLPNIACARLAELIGDDVGRVIAAQEEFRAETEEERSFWHRFSEAAAVAATVIGVTLFVTPPPDAVAAQGVSAGQNSGYTLFILEPFGTAVKEPPMTMNLIPRACRLLYEDT